MAPSPEDQVPGTDKRSPLGLPMRVGEADLTKTSKIWTKVRHNVHKAHGPHRPSYLAEMPNMSAILPYYWQLYPPDFNKYLKQEMCDLHMWHFLEDKKVLNWYPRFTKLYPLNATGDGNCLLHAISLALWGVEDNDLWLRKLLHDVMTGEYAGANESRWRRERNRFDTMNIPGSGFRYNTKEWSAEWQIVVDISSPERRINQMMGLPYACLEEFHIFIMANILRRPIIILAENMWRDAAGQSLQPLNFSGIYLPLAWEAKDCYRHPIVLGYHQMHFSPLVCTAPAPAEGVKGAYYVPLADNDLEALPIHFLQAEEEGMADGLLQRYLSCQVVEIRGRIVLCAVLPTDPPKDEFDVFDSYLKLAELRYRMYSEEQHNPENAEALKAAGVMSATTVQQLNEKVAAGGEPKQKEHPRQNSASEPLDDIPSEDSVCISSTALKSSTMSGVGKNPQHTSYLGGTALPCKKAGCPYVRALESDEYCESCYKSMTTVGKEAFKKCRTETCLNSGDRRYGGLCQVCYDQDTFMNDDAGSVARPALLQELSTSPRFSGLHARGPVHFDPASVQDGDRMDVDEDKMFVSGRALDTNVVNEFTVGSKQCTTPGCDFTGNPKFVGLCSKCFQDNAEAGKKSLGGAESVGYLDSSPPREIPLTVGKQKCLMEDCQLTGHPEKGDLCSGCFNKQAEILKAANLSRKATSGQPSSIPDTNIPGLSRGLSTERQKQLLPQQCHTPKCEMYAHPSQNGFCSACYKKFTAGKSSPYGVSRGPQSPQRKSARDQDTSTFRPVLQFTVKKNMCAMPGCNGVRLQLGTGELCRAHHQETSKRYSPTTRTPPPMGTKTRAGLPSVGGRAQPSAPPQSIYASRPVPGYHFPETSSAGDIHQETGAAQIARTSSTQICLHPKCDSPAVAPMFFACRSCQDFVDKINRLEADMRDVRREVTASQPSDVRLPPTDEEVSPIAMESEMELYDPPTDTVRNLDIHEKPTSGTKGKFDYGYHKRVKCQAKGGCPYNTYGNPSYGDVCAKCFDRDVVGIHNTSSSSAPLKKPSSHTLPPRSKSAVIPSTSTASRAVPRPSNYQKCAARGCEKQANLQTLDGYCNECYPVYRHTKPDAKKKSSSSSVQGRSTVSSVTSKRGKPVTMDTILPSNPSRCRIKDCSNFGNALSRGFCNDCYCKMRAMNSYE